MTAADLASIYGFLAYAVPLCMAAGAGIILWMRSKPTRRRSHRWKHNGKRHI